jgi:serine kinase of HPr protein (carbohydrate metabolism regulator)
MSYTVQLISPQEKEALYEEYESQLLYSSKANIYGCCIKLLTDSIQIKDKWEDNFYTADENNRSHGRLIAISQPNQPLTVKYDPYTKTAFLINVDYYGWVKSLALAVAGDILEDEHRIYSVHGAAIDVGCMGVSIIAPSGTGKTTHSWGLLRIPTARLISDDWYFVRLSTREPLAFSSEKNTYIQADIGKIWNEYERLVDKTQFDNRGRAIVNIRWIVGAGGVIPMATLNKIIMLKRDQADPTIATELETEAALEYLLAHNFCNPHQLVQDERKLALRTKFFRRLFSQSDVYLVNTVGTPQQTQAEIRRLLKIKQ